MPASPPRARLVVLALALSAGLAVAAPASAQSEEPAVLLAAGDIASCKSLGDEATAAILDGEPGVVATLGDNAYENGTPAEFAECYHPSWGRHLARTRPSVGNHEYRIPGAFGYFGYFGALAGDPATGYYAYDLGSWRILVLNSNCGFVGGCHTGSPQDRWLRAELAASPDCTLAYFHHARHSSGRRPQLDGLEPIWAALYEHGADVVLSGHDHIYERFQPQTPAGDPNEQHGIRQFTVGTGGHSHSGLPTRLRTSEVVNNDTFGVIKLTLRAGGYDWVFLPEAGKTFTDSGSDVCRHAPADTTRPTVSLTAPEPEAVLRGTQRLAAEAADDVGVERVDFLVDHTVVAQAPRPPYEVEWDTTSFADGLRMLRARSVDTSGNADTTAPRWVVIDNELPRTSFNRTPGAFWRLRTATFGFASEPGATFECSLDRAPFSSCSPPVRYEGLAEGAHTFAVRARDAAGNLEAAPVTWRWVVDVRAPQTRIDLGRMSRGPAGTATFRFAASEPGATFACSLDGAAWKACSSPATFKGLRSGAHSFRVRATDRAGNTDWTPAQLTWTSTRSGTGVVLVGSERADVLVGSPGDDLIYGLGGNDVIRAGAGNDVVDGGPGADRVNGGPGHDRLTGGAGPDVLLGGRGRDRASVDRGLDVVTAVETRF